MAGSAVRAEPRAYPTKLIQAVSSALRMQRPGCHRRRIAAAGTIRIFIGAVSSLPTGDAAVARCSTSRRPGSDRASRRRAASRGRAISYRKTWSTSANTARSGSATHGWPRTRRTRARARENAGDWSPPPPPPKMIWRGAHAQEFSSSLSCGGKNPIVFNGLALLTRGSEGRAWQRLVASGCLLTSLWWSLPAAAAETGLGALVGANRRLDAVSGSRSRMSPRPRCIAFQTTRHLGDFRPRRFFLERIPRRC